MGRMMKFDPSTRRLANEALSDAKTLARTEAELAKDELVQEAERAAGSAIGAGVAMLAGLAGAELLVLAIARVTGRPTRTSVLGVALVGVAVAAGWFAWRMLPRDPMRRTRERLATDVEALKH